jgi:hypothetical protein
VTTKEHTVVLPALLLLTDYFFESAVFLGGIRRNPALYVPVTACGFSRLFTSRRSYGALDGRVQHQRFHVVSVLFTQCRAFWLYIRLFRFGGLNIDSIFRSRARMWIA